ncbi:MAG: hypothetical protein JW985_03650 [Alphaproteobacteria bacterium]|nr:hypothetical protein [Alphaproteobacteria bacterium]
MKKTSLLLIFILSAFFITPVFAATVVCSPGFYYKSGNKCTGCTAGNYCPGIDATKGAGVQGLIKCPTGSYCMAWSSAPTSCTSADSDYPYSNPGATTQTQCYITCSAGEYVPWYGAPCTPCMAGYYNETASFDVFLSGSSSCTACPINYNDGDTGTTSINQCKWTTTAGTYIATPGATTATSCPSGYICPSETVTYGQTNSPTICPENYYCPSWSQTPLSCASANSDFPYSDPGAADSSECYTMCPAGEYVPWYGAACTPCPSGTYGSDQPTRAALGGNSCNACPTNYNDGDIGATSISQCAWTTTAGTYIATPMTTTATTCLPEYYCPSDTINYGNTGTMLTCPGAPAGSTSSDACVMYINGPNGKRIRLHGSKQTSPSLYIKMSDGTQYYGNLRTWGATDFMINLGGTTYYLYY